MYLNLVCAKNVKGRLSEENTKQMKLIGIFFLFVIFYVILLLATASRANIVYSNDFESAIGNEWSDTRTDVTPIGERHFLGQFAENDAVSLTLENLAAHDNVMLSFDLFVLQSWDGTSWDFGPDIWQADVENGQILIQTTFSNTGDDGHLQNYTGSYSDGVEYDAYTGASEINTLGYEYYGDSVYRFNFNFKHIDDTLKINFAGIGLQDSGDESWGLDNVKVELSKSMDIPEPSTLALLATFGMVFVAKGRGRAATNTSSAE